RPTDQPANRPTEIHIQPQRSPRRLQKLNGGLGLSSALCHPIPWRSVLVERTMATSIWDLAAPSRSRFRKVSAEIGR
ncbi:hypothetical protein, partial [Candidatus Protofrankia californiensis]|uniref:hypothetical protein n=1 Tax=Candidatus Protofrankia californiensis TaxID=1839754 RepID=UPI0019D2F8EA